jgi:hypothetical protein
LRGELIWQKAEGATGSCAWGSFRSAANPVLRDITERVIVASKGRFSRARTAGQREAEGLPFENTLMTEDFMALTLDVWNMPTESAKRVGHPAPFPVELPEQLIRLYTYKNDLVLDPFLGSGSTAVAAAALGRRYVGYDLDPAYVEIARSRVAELDGQATEPPPTSPPPKTATAPDDPAPDNFARRAGQEGKAAAKLAAEVLERAGFEVVATNKRIARAGVSISFVVADAAGDEWYVDVPGANTTHRGGLLRRDTVWKTLGRAHALRGATPSIPLLLLTTSVPRPKSEGDRALRAAGPKAFFDAIEMLDEDGRARLAQYCAVGAVPGGPLAGFWTARELTPLV